MAYERLGKLEDAVKCLARSLKYDPGFLKSLRQKQRLEALIVARGGKKTA
jgi:hypothetical protein